MMTDTPTETIETIDALFTDDTLATTASDDEASIPTGQQQQPPRHKHADKRPPNRRVRRAFARVFARMQDDVRNLGVHVICGRPYVGPTHNRCSCPVKLVQATGSVAFLATHERGKHDL